MNIMLVGSMAFVKDMVKIKKQLEKLNYHVEFPCGSEPHLKDANFVDSLEENYKFCVKNNVMKRCFDQVAGSDAILVINLKRNDIEGYIGTSALMEMAVAHHLGKKIFLLNKVPHFNKARWSHEVSIMQPIVINGDLALIR